MSESHVEFDHVWGFFFFFLFKRKLFKRVTVLLNHVIIPRSLCIFSSLPAGVNTMTWLRFPARGTRRVSSA